MQSDIIRSVIMLKHSFVLAFMAILFLLKPSFVKPEDSSDVEDDSSTEYNRRKYVKCTGPNEYYSCGGACDNICATLSEQNQTNCPIVNIVCNEMCYCEEGYARAKNNTCIPFDRCTEPQCPVNEKYVQCPSALCTPKTCSQLGFPLNCTFASNDDECDEKPGCICIDGYVRNHKGVCIPKNNCPSCGGDKNAEPGCGVNCGRHCSNYFHKGGFACPAICLLNGCQCKPGMYYDDVMKKCVKPEDCTPICSKNEVVSNCVNGGCDQRNCSQLNDPILCIDPITCKKGCVCAEGYLRHPNGTCVPINECPPVCGKDEVYNSCIQGQCQPKNCSDLGKPIACPRIDPKYCIKGCLCKDGYVRAKNGTCIPKKDCPSCGGDYNAQAGCGENCNKKCSDIGKEEQSCIEICYENGCDCKDGFYYDENRKKCVRRDACIAPTCRKHEEYSECIQGQCRPKDCSQIGMPLPCPLIDSRSCIKGCICKNNYVRDIDGTCIPKNECRTCGGDPNAVPGCGLNCNKHCSNVGKGKGICPRIQCPPNGCECKDGYYFDSTVKKCVLPEDCCPSEN